MMAHRWPHRIVVFSLMTGLCSGLLATAGCAKQQRPTETQEAPGPAAPETGVTTDQSAKPKAEAPEPSTKPAETRPVASKPASTYDSSPPYPVQLYVANPEEKQPGWLKILAMDDQNSLAIAKGTFPVRNRIYVETTNVRQIRIHVDQLPLAHHERLILQIDGQGMVLSKDRKFATLERLSTGEWIVLKDED